MTKNLKKQLSDDAKIARVEAWALRLGLDPKDTSAALTEKYGPYAYEVMSAVMMKPVAAVQQTGGQVKNSREAADYFIKHHIPTEDFAKAFGKDVQTMEAEIAAYREANPKAEETAEQKEMRERQEQFNSHFNDEMNRNREVAEKTVDPEKVDISRMTIDDYAKYCRPEDKPAANYEELVEKAYEDFGKGEGFIRGLYLDSKGLPTIGNGHLVLARDALNKPERLKAYRDMYVSTPLVGADGKPLTEAQKKVQFSQITLALKNGTFKTSGGCPNLVTSPATGKLNNAGMKHLFIQDFKYTYDVTKKAVPNIDKMPLPVQLAALHSTFAFGNANKLKKVDVNSPAELMEQVDKLRNRKGTSAGERETIKLGNDSIKVAQDNYRLELTRRSEMAAKAVELGKEKVRLSVHVSTPQPASIRLAMVQRDDGR